MKKASLLQLKAIAGKINVARASVSTCACGCSRHAPKSQTG